MTGFKITNRISSHFLPCSQKKLSNNQSTFEKKILLRVYLDYHFFFSRNSRLVHGKKISSSETFYENSAGIINIFFYKKDCSRTW